MFSLAGWSRRIHAGFLVSRATQVPVSSSNQDFAYGAVTRCGPPFQTVRLSSSTALSTGPTTPDGALPRLRFGLLRVRSPLLAESLLFSFPPGTEMFQFPGLASILLHGCRSRLRRVAPFGNPRVRGYLPLAAAYRSLSRPSSPPRAKASFMCPFLLSLVSCRS